MKDIKFANHSFILDPSGLLLWPEEKIAIVADLHLEKGSYFASFGQMLPNRDSYETLEKLEKSLAFSGCSKLILLGDSFHDEAGFHRLEPEAKKLFENICSTYEVLWVIGNHDGAFIPENTNGFAEIKIKNIIFRHEAEDTSKFEISGHYHPKAQLKLYDKKVIRPCFLVDKQRIILPAFGTFTGGLDIKSNAISHFFKNNYTAYLLGNNKIYTVPSNKI